MEGYMKELELERGTGKSGVISVCQVELHPWLGRSDIVGMRFSDNLLL
jgi:hypothetical protein